MMAPAPPSAALSWRAVASATTVAITAGWLTFALLVWFYGDSPRLLAAAVVEGTWGHGYGLGQVLYKATPLLLTGLSIEIALRAGLFNIGAEGQLAVAGLAVAVVGSHLPASSPSWCALPLEVVVAAGAGSAWALVPAVLRGRFGAHEVISTIMMNRLADVGIGLVLAQGLGALGMVRTPDVVASARLARLDRLGISAFHGSAVSLALPVSLAILWGVTAWFGRSRMGRETVLVALAPGPCAAERIPIGRRLGGALLLSGALAGLGSLGPVLGYKGYYESGLASGAGFVGIAVALLGRGHPVGLVLAALLFATLEQGGLAINGRVPREAMTVLEGVVILALALADARVRRAWAPGRDGGR